MAEIHNTIINNVRSEGPKTGFGAGLDMPLKRLGFSNRTLFGSSVRFQSHGTCAGGTGHSRFMIAEIDIWRTAWLMVKRHEDNATFEAAQQADELLDEGDIDGAATWGRILSAIERIQSTDPADEGSQIH